MQIASASNMRKRVRIPSVNLWGGFEAVDSLLIVLAPHWDDAEPLVLDFSACGFISADAVAVLTVLKLWRTQQGIETEIDWSTMVDKLKIQFGRWEVSRVFGGGNHPWTDNAIPLLHQRKRDSAALVAFVEKWVVTSDHMPKMTPELAKEVRKSFCELFSNVFLHSESAIGAIVIGQLYPKVKQVQICVCDAGIGLVQRVQACGHAKTSPVDAILWALEPGHSTSLDDRPHGLGLYLLQEFIKVNGGDFRIYANKGYYAEDSGVPCRRILKAALPGTLVELRLIIRDDVTYTLSSD
jgi:hypothetical protein